MLQFFNLHTHFPFTTLRGEGQTVEKKMIICNISVSCSNKTNHNKNSVTN